MAYFPDVSAIPFEGPESTNPLAFRHYDPAERVEGTAMRDLFRFSTAYWHTFRGTGSDPFGPGTAVRPWEDGTDSLQMDLKRVDVAFEFMQKLGTPFYCFHDRDVSGAGDTLKETNARFDKVTAKLKEQQSGTGIKLLWGTANLFSHPRYMHGAATQPRDAAVFAHARRPGEKGDRSHPRTGAGRNYVFWGGREGYFKPVQHRHEAGAAPPSRTFMHMAVDYAKEIGFTGQFPVRAQAEGADEATSTTSTWPPA